jgi:hypothetical protein
MSSVATGWKKDFFDNLKAKGLFTRDYDGVCAERLPRIAGDLHTELCHLDESSWSTGWEELTLVEFVNAYAKASPGLRSL